MTIGNGVSRRMYSLFKSFFQYSNVNYLLRGYIKVVGSGVSACKKIDLMPINVTVVNSGKIALPEIIKNVTIYTS